MIDLIRTTKIEKVVQESSNIKSFFFRDEQSLSSLPGQFVMVWLPGIGEFPMSLSISKADLASIAVKGLGQGSKRLYESKVNQTIGLRGPYGNWFGVNDNKRLLLVGGGTGMAPMIAVANRIPKDAVKAKHAIMVIAAKTKIEIPFVKISSKILGSENVFVTTDDGSAGFKGLAHEKVQELVSKYKFDQVFSCGPEKMMSKIYQIARSHGIRSQFSFERIMKCGIGVCGSCTIGDVVLCKDGPILSETQIEKISPEFGRIKRDKTGTLVAI